MVNNSSPVDIYIGLSNYASINLLGDVASSVTIFIADAILVRTTVQVQSFNLHVYRSGAAICCGIIGIF